MKKYRQKVNWDIKTFMRHRSTLLKSFIAIRVDLRKLWPFFLAQLGASANLESELKIQNGQEKIGRPQKFIENKREQCCVKFQLNPSSFMEVINKRVSEKFRPLNACFCRQFAGDSGRAVTCVGSHFVGDDVENLYKATPSRCDAWFGRDDHFADDQFEAKFDILTVDISEHGGRRGKQKKRFLQTLWENARAKFEPDRDRFGRVIKKVVEILRISQD